MNLSAGFTLSCLAVLRLAAGNMVSPGLGKCLDIMAALKADGTTRENEDDMKKKTTPINVQLYTCHEKHNQDWEIIDSQIKSLSLERCLTVNGTVADNSNVYLVECGGDKANLQKWDLTGFGYIKSAGSDFCLDVKAALKADGTRENWTEIKSHTAVNVHLYNCHDPNTTRVNQLWEWAPFSGDEVVSEWEFLGTNIHKPTASGNGSMAFAAASMASLFAAGIFIGLRMRRPAAVQQPMAELDFVE
jgi:hypothetical protein